MAHYENLNGWKPITFIIKIGQNFYQMSQNETIEKQFMIVNEDDDDLIRYYRFETLDESVVDQAWADRETHTYTLYKPLPQ